MRDRIRGSFQQAISIICALLLMQASWPAQLAGQDQPAPLLSAGQLQDLVAPIALYPDPLLGQILVASTYPVEIVEAYQWLQRNSKLTGEALVQGASAENWDPSVQALVVFPDVLKQLNTDIRWTETIGNAFRTQQSDVMKAVQQMRFEAAQAGKLNSTPQQQVATTYDAGQPVVTIVPTSPDVIYVPTYDPYTIWGAPAYYPYAAWYYPGVFGFGAGIALGAFFGYGWHGWGGWGWHPSWHSHSVTVNNSFARNNHFNTGHNRNFNAYRGYRGGNYAYRGGNYYRGAPNRGGAAPGLRAKPSPAPRGGMNPGPAMRNGNPGFGGHVRSNPGVVPHGGAVPQGGAPHGGGFHGGGGFGGGGHGGGGFGGGGHGGGGFGGGGHGGGGHGGGHR